MVLWIFHLLIIAVASVIGYSILIGVNNKQLANLVFMVAVMLGLLTTIQDLTPVIQKWSARVDSWQNSIDKISNIGQGKWKTPMKGEISQLYKGVDHHGIDIAAPLGTRVKASKEGDIKSVGWSDIYGNVVIVDHGGGTESSYAHLQGIDVKAGYPVLAGDNIGSCGSTGNSTGPHLHFEIRVKGKTVDPLPYLEN